jgi:ElaB/YqjD/DUF883 family membrane-anchored ribosome-binding protein
MPMNPPPDSPADPKAIRAQIDETRRQMDETIDALGQRMQGRHLVDEALHFVRKQTENGNMTQLKNQLKRSADTAVHSVVNTVKANPIPAALVGAGIAWYVYSQTRDDSSQTNYYADGDPIRGYTDEPYGGAAGGGSDVGQFVDGGESSGMSERIREKADEIRDRSREAIHTAKEKLHEAGERASELGTQVKQRSRELVRQGRDRVVDTVDKHPLESGLVCLALGLLAGLALPTAPRVRTAIAPRARQLRRRTEEVIDKSREVARSTVDAAKHAAKQAAQDQGLVKNESPTQTAQAPA